MEYLSVEVEKINVKKETSIRNRLEVRMELRVNIKYIRLQ
jgi:hypothetical protein